MTLHTVFVGSRYYNRSSSYKFGTVEIRLGNYNEEFNSVNNVVWPAAYDGGFFPIGTTISGRYLTFRRIYLDSDID